MEKYMAFNLGPLRFLDSMQFCKSSLSSLAENLGAVGCKKRDCTEKSHLWRIDKNRCFAHPERFRITAQHAPKEHLEIYLRKGIYPYDYMRNWDVFNETKLPPKEAFYSKLNNSGITDEEYKYAKYVWEKPGCKTLRDLS